MPRIETAPAFALIVTLADGRSDRQPAHTLKAARHAAKKLAGNAAVTRIALDGPDGSSELYAR